MKQFAKKFIGDKAFYKMVLLIVIPIIIQNGITNFVSLLDNIMVGRIGTEQMSGVAIANQLMFVFNITIFGAISGASIFGAQFFGLGDYDGVRHAFRFKLILSVAITLLAIGIFMVWGEQLILYYLHEQDSALSIEATLEYGRKYLNVMLVGLLPYAISQSYASTLRDCGETALPMKAGIAAVLVNLVLNYILIFGNFGAPKLGIEGAAIATVTSRFVELLIILVVVHRKQNANEGAVSEKSIAAKAYAPVFQGAYRSLRIPGSLVKKIILTGTPLLLNEALWALGKALMNQCYSVRGLEVVAAMNISTTIENLFNVFFIAMGSAIAIVVGQQLGAGHTEEAVDTDRKMIFFSVVSCLVVGGALIAVAPLIPKIYNTEELVREIATDLIIVSACCMPMNAFNHASYFTMRSGGKTFITFLFDSVFVWVVNIPLAYALAHYTGLSIVWMYALCLGVDVIKCVIGFILIKKRVWVKNIVA
ncbi:MAG: MATE family efflux transporter [Lachnospiraceae bacterium]|nr:MATE family efflux transporter [Lachnospiraceae bacterium]